MTASIWWVRRDLRLADNQALNAALAAADWLIPVFILDPAILSSDYVGDAARGRVAFLFDGLRWLDASLRSRGSRLIIRQGDPVEELTRLMDESSAKGIFAEEDTWLYGRKRDARVAQVLPLHLTGGLAIHPPEVVLKPDSSPYMVFTPFSRAWKALPLPPAREVLAAPGPLPAVPHLDSLPIPAEPALPNGAPFQPGEAEAHRRLGAFVEGDDSAIYRYAKGRDRLDLAGTSQLSPYLRFGMVSARQAAASARRAIEAAPDAQARSGAETWLTELIWRDFYLSIQYHFPETERYSFRADLRDITWENDEMAFAAWCQGRTGYPVVDAAMRQLAQTGWMHNRARMIVASFLVKDLLIDWRWGERWFMQHLVDADPAANNGGWQWTAGTGTDSAPYFRIFHPVLQGRKHDPEGAYVRQWLPELAHVPGRYIHAPWETPPEVQQTAGCIIGQDYPAPIIDHAWARERALAAYAQAKQMREKEDQRSSA
ncbi:MAG: deoxyribodipyrimidine photo-lyase [Anaerolineae bacterium]|nr:deoxyribodipyrimidine photo-lyase [Anaerolineae bacterium]